MFKILSLILCLGSWAVVAQPLLNKQEFVLEYTLKNDISKPKISASIFSSSLGKIQTVGVYKLSGKHGQLGGQVWVQANEYVWLGMESVSNIELDLDHELFIAGQFSYKKITLLPFMSVQLSTESLGTVGAIVYLSKLIKVGGEMKFHKESKDKHYAVLFGLRLDGDVLKKIQDILVNKEVK